MINITLLSFISSSLISSSPAFVNDHFSLANCKFQKFSTLFYNQRILYLKGCSFIQNINEIIHNEHETVDDGNHRTIQNENNMKDFSLNVNNDMSITIIDCFFTKTQTYAIKATDNRISLYITNCYFNDCLTEEGLICLQRTRCVTITHTCCSLIKITGQYAFLYFDCREIDFSVFLYNSIVDVQRNDDKLKMDGSIVNCRSGDQYFRCNNITKCNSNAFSIDAPYCFSFAINTVVNCDCSCLRLTGTVNKVQNKILDKVNFFSNGIESQAILYLTNNDRTLTIQNSVLLSSINHLVQREDYPNLIILNCIVNRNVNSNDAQIIDPTYQDFNTKHVTRYPHFTYGNLCVGPTFEKKDEAFGCNVGNCIDTDCDRTIGFPDGVVPYTTILHTDMQTPTFTPSSYFSKSDKFTETDEFSQSETLIPLSSSSSSEADEVSSSLDESSSIQTTEFDEYSSDISFTQINITDEFVGGDDGGGGNQDKSGKGNNKKKVGIIAGVVAAVVVILVIIAVVFVIRKKKMMNNNSSGDVVETHDSAVTTNNALHGMMNEDDPFDGEFHENGAATNAEEL